MTSRARLWDALAWLLAAYLGWVLVTSAAPKLANPLGFSSDLVRYRFFPAWSLSVLTVMVPWTEVVVGVGLLIRRNQVIEWSALALFCGFTLVVLIALLSGSDVPCGCGAACAADPTDRTSWPKIWHNLAYYIAPSVALTTISKARGGIGC